MLRLEYSNRTIINCGDLPDSNVASLSSRRLEVMGARKNGRARGRHKRGEGNGFRGSSGQALPLPSRVSLSRARLFLRPLLSSVGAAWNPP